MADDPEIDLEEGDPTTEEAIDVLTQPDVLSAIMQQLGLRQCAPPQTLAASRFI